MRNDETITAGVPQMVMYTKKDGNTTARPFIPIEQMPLQHIKGFDLSKMDPVERSQLASICYEYQDYYNQRKAQILDFNQWLEASGRESSQYDSHYRTWIASNLTTIE